ncbi:unnamed protein product [Orchesella dallaii]|uniref:Pre-mRNA-splicing factor SYF1 n=1 Tax=Orchesella dallaii TaxID=48710 RepID=A0ABP1PRI8_9HEXA
MAATETDEFVESLTEQDLAHEEEILRNPFSIKHWMRYLDHLRSEKKYKKEPKRLYMVYERALKQLPGSYKLWHAYLVLRKGHVLKKSPKDPAVQELFATFERSLVFMNKMPRIWIEYCDFAVKTGRVTQTRRIFDRALRSLPITQHNRIWPMYLNFVTKKHLIPETATRIYKRYLKLCPENAEDFIEYLLSVGRLDEAAVRLAHLVNNENFTSRKGKSNYVLWNELCNLISKNPKEVTSLDVDAIIRSGLRRYTDQIGALWTSLADYYVRSGLFERSRDIYEEGISSVTTVRDFSQIFDAYAQFEEAALTKLMESDDVDDLIIEMRLARLENLMERRPLLLNSVLLRQNPHNVNEWLKRVDLLKEKPKEVIAAFTEGVQTVDPKQAVGKLNALWVAFAKFYEDAGQLDDARVIFEKSTHVPYMKVDDLGHVWCEWAEMELRHKNYKEALRLMYTATTPPVGQRAAYSDDSATVQARLYKNLKLWSFYADLEESFGTYKSCKAVYDRIIDLKIATPQIIMNYGIFLEENQYFEEAFKAYEKGISLFKWPHVFDLWNTYLAKFLERYGGDKIERARDLFEQCLETCPAQHAKNFYLLYAKLEEKHGAARRSMNVYERACKAVDKKDQYQMFNIYIQKAATLYGVTKTRPIFEAAMEVLPDADARQMGIRFAELETKLGEIDRARAIYAHTSQICDPRVSADFWAAWKDFEVRHGNEDTIREMLRVKRSVQALYNTQFTANLIAQQTQLTPSAIPERTETTAEASEIAAAAVISEPPPPPRRPDQVSFVRGDTLVQTHNMDTTNPDEIELDEDDEEDNEKDEEMEVEKVTIPTEVFGSLKPDDVGADEDE